MHVKLLSIDVRICLGKKNGGNSGCMKGMKLVTDTLLETNSSPLKMGAPWKPGDSYWKPPFLAAMLVLGRVMVKFKSYKTPVPVSTGEMDSDTSRL